jgi:para-nitrobenzyl esterase
VSEPQEKVWGAAAPLERETGAGRLRGLRLDDVAVFRGIPFAEPPVGALRFAAPRRRARLAGTFDATRWGATPQRVSPYADPIVPEPTVPGDDILTLNVFGPAEPAGAALPVLVWIHGGGYVAGSAIGEWYDGRTLVTEGVVVVSVAYRLGFDGFGHLPDAPDNRGMLDWIAALEWVRDTIADFGGDPGNVTIAGQSAGGGAVLALLAAPQARGLFARAWSLSGITGTVGLEEAAEETARIAAQFGVSADATGFASVTDRALQQAAVDRGESSIRPVADAVLLPHGVLGGLAASADIPLVLGATADEFVGLDDEEVLSAEAALAFFEAEGSAPEDAAEAVRRIAAQYPLTPGRLATESSFRAAVLAVLARRVGSAAPTWAYDFRSRTTVSGFAVHCYDIPYVFGTTGDPSARLRLGDPDPAIEAALHAATLAFLRGERLDWAPAPGTVGTATGFAEFGGAGDHFAAAEPLVAREG